MKHQRLTIPTGKTVKNAVSKKVTAFLQKLNNYQFDPVNKEIKSPR